MAETRMLTRHGEIRDWAAARAGMPAMVPAVPSAGQMSPVLRIMFDQQAYTEVDEAHDRPQAVGDVEIVEWSEWFDEFDRQNLGLVVAEDQPGQIDSFHELVVRG
ncbi:MAG: hypothetical protein R3D65_03905 [Zhengella sp.]|uniref:hypothetical protein n=1 Tax=Zhengella sp. TaxID=2282762 RepID=UPI001DE01C42|nr:hypothetical protein [Notoacmeibacter sp.]MCC0026114.1 hypothetical protein [Brucellaceae bacterium]